MKRLRQYEGKLSLLLILAISVLCAGFFIVSCGNDPQQKTKDTNKGAYAIDFSHCPSGESCTASPKGSEVTPVPDISGRDVTLEAWVKKNVTSTLGGGIFGRFAGFGAKLSVDNDSPKFVIGRLPIQTTSTEPVGCTAVGVTTTECTVNSGISLIADVWTHIAGVLVNRNHNSVHAACGGAQTGAEAQIPHLDIYINGDFVDCSTTGSLPVDNPGNEDMVIGFLNGAVIDELRLWVFEKSENDRKMTEAERIKKCMNTELGVGGDCDRGDRDLAAYYRLNEGEGADVTDISGNGFSGGFEWVRGADDFPTWEDGWVTPGAPIKPAD